MSLALETVAYGPPATQGLLAALRRAKGSDPLRPVTVVVAGDQVGVALRRQLASGALGPTCSRGTGLAATSFVTIHRLAEALAASRLAGQGRRPASPAVIGAALRASLAEHPGVFASVADQQATELALAAALAELRLLSEPALAALAGQSRRASELVRLHAAVRDRLTSRFYDERDQLEAAQAALDADPSAALGLGTVVCYLPRELDRSQAQLLASLARHTEVLVLAGRTGVPEADLAWHRTEELLAGPSARPKSPSASTRTLRASQLRIVTCPDAEEEVRAAVRAVLDAVRAGTPLERIAILYSSAQPYARLIYEQLEAAGIAYNGPSLIPAAEGVAGRALLGLIRLAGSPLSRQELFAWLAGLPIHYRGRPAPVATWEAVSREALVVEGQDWDRRLLTYADRCEAQGAPGQAHPAGAGHLQAPQRAQAARELRAFVLDLSHRLELASGQQPWRQRAAWAAEQLKFLLDSQAGWPEPERRMAEVVEGCLRRLGKLDCLEDPVSLEAFARSLEAELTAKRGRQGRMGRGVSVGPVEVGVGLDLELVTIVGLAEGLLPSEVHEDPLLPDSERQALGGELALAADQVRCQHHNLLAVMAGADNVVLLVPRGDLRRSTQWVPSRFVTALASELAGRPLGSRELFDLRPEPWLDHVASFQAGLARSGFPATDQEHRLSSLMAAGAAGRLDQVASSLDDPVLAAGAEALAARESDRFTRFDGNLAGLSVPSPTANVTSPSCLEEWAHCPFAYFMHVLLGLEPVEEPELRLELSPRDQGSLLHEVLAGLVGEALRNPPPANAPWTEQDRRRLRELAEQAFCRFEQEGRPPPTALWRQTRRRLLGRLDRFLDADSARCRKLRLRPAAVELSFGPASPIGPVALPLPDGRTVRFKGRLDRLDLSESGMAHVVDYKTGSPEAYKGLSEQDPTDSGRHLQLPVYALAACLHTDGALPVQVGYWFLDEDEPRGYLVTDEVIETVSQVVGQLVVAIEAGVFPPNPPESPYGPRCRYCSPDSAPTAELRRLIERKLGLSPPDTEAGPVAYEEPDV